MAPLMLKMVIIEYGLGMNIYFVAGRQEHSHMVPYIFSIKYYVGSSVNGSELSGKGVD